MSLLAKCQWERLAAFSSWPFLSDSWQETHNAVTTALVPGEAAHLKAVLYLALISHHWPAGFCWHFRSFFLSLKKVPGVSLVGKVLVIHVFPSSSYLNYNQKFCFTFWHPLKCGGLVLFGFVVFFLMWSFKIYFIHYWHIIGIIQNMGREDKECKKVTSGCLKLMGHVCIKKYEVLVIM